MVAALALDHFELGPKFRIELDNNINNSLILDSSLLALDLEPFFAPFGIVVTYFSAEFDARFDLGDEVVLDSLIRTALLHIVLDIGWNVLLRNRAIVSWITDMHDVVLFPFLKIVVMMLSEFLTFCVHCL